MRVGEKRGTVRRWSENRKTERKRKRRRFYGIWNDACSFLE